VPTAANVDGYDRVDATHFYLSFAQNTTLPGVGSVQDEDVVYYNSGTWSVYFDGTAHGMGSTSARDLDAVSISADGGTLYFSTVGNSGPPGISGLRDNADIYRWNGTSYARVWDATANGVSSTADVDGLSLVSGTDFYLSFTSTVTLTGIGTNQDEDVVHFSSGTWSVYFNGTAHGLTSSGQDLDAIDVP
jgi:hypothetical protein